MKPTNPMKPLISYHAKTSISNNSTNLIAKISQVLEKSSWHNGSHSPKAIPSPLFEIIQLKDTALFAFQAKDTK